MHHKGRFFSLLSLHFQCTRENVILSVFMAHSFTLREGPLYLIIASVSFNEFAGTLWLGFYSLSNFLNFLMIRTKYLMRAGVHIKETHLTDCLYERFFYRCVQPFGVSGPHWKKKSCLEPRIKYIDIWNHKITS